MRFIEGECQVQVAQASTKARFDLFAQPGVGWNGWEG